MPLSESQITRLQRRLNTTARRSRRMAGRVWESEARWLANRTTMALTAKVAQAASGDPAGLRAVVSGSRFAVAARRRSGPMLSDLGAIVRDYRGDAYDAIRDAHGFPATRLGRANARRILVDGKDLGRWLARFRVSWLDLVEEVVVSAAQDAQTTQLRAKMVRRDIMDRTDRIRRRFDAVLLGPSGAPIHVATTEEA